MATTHYSVDCPQLVTQTVTRVDAPPGDNPVGIIAGSAVAVVVCMIIVIIMVIIFLRR